MSRTIPHTQKSGITRRALLIDAPIAAVGLSVPSCAMAAPAPEADRERIIRLIEQLEAWQGWEPTRAVAAKAFAAWQMRRALGLDLPDPQTAQMHVDFQRQQFESYRRSIWFERDIADGKQCEITPMERTLA